MFKSQRDKQIFVKEFLERLVDYILLDKKGTVDIYNKYSISGEISYYSCNMKVLEAILDELKNGNKALYEALIKRVDEKTKGFVITGTALTMLVGAAIAAAGTATAMTIEAFRDKANSQFAIKQMDEKDKEKIIDLKASQFENEAIKQKAVNEAMKINNMQELKIYSVIGAIALLNVGILIFKKL